MINNRSCVLRPSFFYRNIKSGWNDLHFENINEFKKSEVKQIDFLSSLLPLKRKL